MSGNEKKQLPLGWREAPLGELITVLRGVSYKKQDATTEPAAGKIPILRASNIDDRLNFIDLVYVPQEYVSEVQLLNVGDMVIAASRLRNRFSVIGLGTRFLRRTPIGQVQILPAG